MNQLPSTPISSFEEWKHFTWKDPELDTREILNVDWRIDDPDYSASPPFDLREFKAPRVSVCQDGVLIAPARLPIFYRELKVPIAILKLDVWLTGRDRGTWKTKTTPTLIVSWHASFGYMVNFYGWFQTSSFYGSDRAETTIVPSHYIAGSILFEKFSDQVNTLIPILGMRTSTNVELLPGRLQDYSNGFF